METCEADGGGGGSRTIGGSGGGGRRGDGGCAGFAEAGGTSIDVRREAPPAGFGEAGL